MIYLGIFMYVFSCVAFVVGPPSFVDKLKIPDSIKIILIISWVIASIVVVAMFSQQTFGV